MYGRGFPADVSQYSSTNVSGIRRFSSCRAVLLTSSVRISSSSSWAAASASWVTGAVIALMRESESATMLSWPDM